MELRRRFRVRAFIALATATQVISIVFGVSVLLQGAPASAVASVPYKINFQGRLTDNSGNVLADGSYNIKFRLFDDLAAGTNRWQGDRVRGASDNRITITNGLFNIQFGDTTKGDPALTPALFSTQTYAGLYLEVELPTPATATCATNGCAVFTEGAMTPRQPLASSPYAINTDTLDGLDSSAFGQLAAANTYTAANIFAPTAASTVALTVKATTAGSTNSLEVFDSGGTRRAFFDATGNLNLALTLQATTNNAIDLGTSGAAFRTGYFGTSVVTPALNATSAGGTITTNAATFQRTASGILSLDLVDVADTTLAVTNSGTGAANLTTDGSISIGSGKTFSVGASTGQSSTVSCAAGQAVTTATFTGGVLTTAPGCAAISGASGATTALDNLGTTSINAALLPSANNTRSLGSASLVWANLFVGNLDAGTTTTALTIGTAATTTALTLGRSGYAVSIPGGITTSNGTINTGSGSITTTGAVNAGTVVATTSVSSPIYTGASSVTLQSGGTAQNILLTPSTTGKIQVGGTTPYVTTNGATALTVDPGGAAALNLGSTSASSVNIGNATAATQVLINGGTNATNAIGLTAAANGGILATTTGTGNIEFNTASSVIAQSSTNNEAAFQIQNSSSAPIFMVDTTTTNLITNPGFESGITGWTGGGTGATTAQNLVKTNVYNGFSSLQIGTATSGSTTATVNGFTSSLTAGNYNFSFYANSSVNVAGLAVSFTGGGGTCTPNATTIVSGGFSRYSCSVTTSGTTTAIVITVTTNSATLYIDGVQLSSGLTLLPYRIGGIQLRGVITNPVAINPTSDSQTAFQVTNAAGLRTLTVDTEGASDALEVQIGSSTSIDTIQINLGLDSSSTFAEAGGSCGVTSGQGALYYNTAANVIRGCVGGNWEDMVSTAGLGLQLFGIVPDTGLNPGDLASVTSAANITGPCKVSVGSTTSIVSWTGCTAYSGGRKIIVAAGTTASLTGSATTFQHLCLTGTNNQPALSARSTEVANLATVSMPSVTAPILCLADIKTNTNNNTTISVVYDTRTFTISTKETTTIQTNTNAPVLGQLVQYTATKGVVQPVVTATPNNIAGVVVATTGITSTNTINGIIAVAGPAAVKATAGTIGQYIIAGGTAGYAITSATKVAESTSTIYNLLGWARTSWTGGTACAINSDACAGSVLTSIDKR